MRLTARCLRGLKAAILDLILCCSIRPHDPTPEHSPKANSPVPSPRNPAPQQNHSSATAHVPEPGEGETSQGQGHTTDTDSRAHPPVPKLNLHAVRGRENENAEPPTPATPGTPTSGRKSGRRYTTKTLRASQLNSPAPRSPAPAPSNRSQAQGAEPEYLSSYPSPRPWKLSIIGDNGKVLWEHLLPPGVTTLRGVGRYLLINLINMSAEEHNPTSTSTEEQKPTSTSARPHPSTSMLDLYDRNTTSTFYIFAEGRYATKDEVTVKCCTAAGCSPLFLVVDPQASIRAINASIDYVIKESCACIKPSLLEKQLTRVCAAGCAPSGGASLTHRQLYRHPAIGESLRFCSKDCGDKWFEELAEHKKIFCCWPRGQVEDVMFDVYTECANAQATEDATPQVE